MEANLVVGTFNTEKLTNYKLNAITILMLQRIIHYWIENEWTIYTSASVFKGRIRKREGDVSHHVQEYTYWGCWKQDTCSR